MDKNRIYTIGFFLQKVQARIIQDGYVVSGIQGRLYFFKSYFSAIVVLSSLGRDVIYPFHPGHQLMCHFHNRLKNDLGLLSYFALKLHFSQLCLAIRNSPYYCCICKFIELLIVYNQRISQRRLLFVYLPIAYH